MKNDELTTTNEKPKGVQFPEDLSLRDYFAIRATEKDIEMWQCILAQNGIPTSREEAKFAYADAMLRARNGGAS